MKRIILIWLSFLFFFGVALVQAQGFSAQPPDFGSPPDVSGINVKTITGLAKTFTVKIWDDLKSGLRLDRLPKFDDPVSQSIKNQTEPFLNQVQNATYSNATSSPPLNLKMATVFEKVIFFFGIWERYFFQILH